jgi:RNA polymerase sigma factor (sigma-70 family)
METLDDMALVREYASRGSEAAFETLVTRRLGFVYSAALRQVRDPDLAEEVTQAVFIVLAQKAGRISRKTLLTGWLFRTTRFTALAQIRAGAKRRQREQEARMNSEYVSDAPDAVWEQMAPLLDEALAQLGEKDRQAVLLRFFDNKSLAEVGHFLAASEDAARKRVARALEKLRGYFSKRGVVLTAAAIGGAISANSVGAAPAAVAVAIPAVVAAKGAAAGASTLTLIKATLKLMAWMKAKTALAGLGIILAAGTGTVVVGDNLLSPKEPSYQGKRLLDWLADLGLRQPNTVPTNAVEAIRHMGTRTLPFLLADLDIGNSRRIHYARPDTRTSDERSSQAVRAFEALGPLGKSAIPELKTLLEKNPGYVPLALAGIGPPAVPTLLNCLTNGSFWVRDNTAAALANALFSGRITPEQAQGALPVALENLTYSDTNELFQVNTRCRAAGLLAALQLEPEVSVPALIRGLSDPKPAVAGGCAAALGSSRQDAKAAIPALRKMAGSTNQMLRTFAAASLTNIGPP